MITKRIIPCLDVRNGRVVKAQTIPARRQSCWVSGPIPGPISSTPVVSSTPESSAIRAGTQGAMRKFCPFALEKWNPCSASSGFIT